MRTIVLPHLASRSGVVGVTIRDQQLQSQVEKMAKELEELKMSKKKSVNEVRVEEMCSWCEGRGHVVDNCPGFLAAKEAHRPSVEEVNAAQGWNPYSKLTTQGGLLTRISVGEATNRMKGVNSRINP